MTIEAPMTLKCKLSETQSLKARMSVNGSEFSEYTGTHEVTPKADTEVILQTADKVVRQNISVKVIPCERVTNEAGGKTVTIGGY